MKEERGSILAMLASGKISVEEADQMMGASDSGLVPIRLNSFDCLLGRKRAVKASERLTFACRWE
jgi:hypothetical protein